MPLLSIWPGKMLIDFHQWHVQACPLRTEWEINEGALDQRNMVQPTHEWNTDSWNNTDATQNHKVERKKSDTKKQHVVWLLFYKINKQHNFNLLSEIWPVSNLGRGPWLEVLCLGLPVFYVTYLGSRYTGMLLLQNFIKPSSAFFYVLYSNTLHMILY